MAEPRREGPVGVVLVSHSREVADSVARLAVALAGGRTGEAVAAAGGTGDGGLGTSSELITSAAHRVDAGAGVVVLADLGSAVLTVRALAAEGQELPARTRLLDAPFLEGAVAAVVSAAGGGGMDEVAGAAEDAYGYRKL
jgi:dihydroxyacetone kinase DhaKLM complex PTS-EIIA-like component DhaM